MKKIIFGLLFAFAGLAVAQTTTLTQFEIDTNRLYKIIYKPILDKVVVCTASKYPDATARAACETQARSWGYRFASQADGNAEAKECAKLHAGLLEGTREFKIIDDAATDPWTAWRCLTCTDTNLENVAKRSVRTYVVDKAGTVYDHRMRYFIPPFYATKLGKLNPTFAVTMWNNRKGQIPDILARQVYP